MKQEYLEKISMCTILVQLALGLLDVISDIDYAANAKKSSDEIRQAAIFFVCF